MNAYSATGSRQTTLTRIVALLLALADLAELAGGRSAAIRTLVLLFLWPAEAAARRFVMEVCGYAHDTPLPYLEDDEDSAAAVRLALSFRVLAAMLAGLPEWALDEWGFALQPALGNLHEVCELLRHALALHPPERLDSS